MHEQRGHPALWLSSTLSATVSVQLQHAASCGSHYYTLRLDDSMAWWGKLVGGAFGFLSAGPLGAILGVAAGHTMDAGWRRLQATRRRVAATHERTQAVFFGALFSVMGYVAKADGRVSSDEIALAEAVMAHMALSAEQRDIAISLFNQGRQPDFALDATLDQLKHECRNRRVLLRIYMEVLLQAAYADGDLAPGQREALEGICARLGISRFEFAQLETVVRTTRAWAQGRGGARRPSGHVPHSDSKSLLQQDYALLEVSPAASDDEVKRAYRRLMNQHHPDKLVSKGLPEEMLRLAKERTQQIRSAYDRIRKARHSDGSAHGG